MPLRFRSEHHRIWSLNNLLDLLANIRPRSKKESECIFLEIDYQHLKSPLNSSIGILQEKYDVNYEKPVINLIVSQE